MHNLLDEQQDDWEQPDSAVGDLDIQSPAAKVVVEIFVAEHCFVCDYAYEVADTIRRNFPTVDLRVIDIQKTTQPIPERVFATPTYLLNGRVWSLGNPSPQQVQETLTELTINH